MALTISNNGAVQAASCHLGKAQQGFDISLQEAGFREENFRTQ